MAHNNSRIIVVTANTTWYLFNFRIGLIKELQKNGYSVFAISPNDEYVCRLEDLGIVCYNIEINSKGTNPISDISLIYKYFKLLNKIKPHLILSYTIKPNIYGNLAAQILEIPVINTVSGLGTIFIKKTSSSYIGRLLYYISFYRTNWVFFQNTTDREQFIKEGIVNSNNSSMVCGSGVNILNFFFNRTINKGKVFLFAGRLLGDKGIREFIEAAKKITKIDSTIKFIIVGELGSNNNTAISSDELNLWLDNPQIIYKGKTDDIVSELVKADVMVLPSYREGLSKSLIEAAAMKLPIITTNVPGCREVVVHGLNGYLCNAKDPEDLYIKMLDMIKLTEIERIKMGEFSRSIAENTFDEKIIISKYLEKISFLIKNKFES
jgi:glycosyltransferase involved in cell wall biosynthesis